MTQEVRTSFHEALAWLEANGVKAITGSSTSLLRFQTEARRHTKLPVFMSPLLALPVIQALLKPSQKILMLTANGGMFARMKDVLLSDLGATVQVDRLVVAGVEDLPEVEAGLPAASDLFERELLKLARGFVESMPEIQAVLVESVGLVSHSNALRSALRLPVFDAFTMRDFFWCAHKDNPRFGKNDWQFSS